MPDIVWTKSDTYQKSLNLTENQPLYPFIEVQVGGITVTDFTDELSDTLMEFVCTRKSTAEVNQDDQFELTLYDDSAIEIENILYNAMQMVATSGGGTGSSDGEGLTGAGASSAEDASGVRTMSYKATMRRDLGNHKKGDSVEVIRLKNRDWQVKGTNNTVPSKKRDTYFNMKSQIYDNKVQYSKSVAESWVNTNNIGSATDWLFWCNKYGQKVYIFKGSKGNWSLQKTFACSTGSYKNGINSDQGIGFNWKIWDKDRAFRGSQATQYYNQHYSSKGGNSIHSGGNGKPITHGCIAIKTAGAKWVFNNVPINTKVVVY